MPRSNNFLAVALILAAVVLTVPIVTMTLFKDGLFYPHLAITTPEGTDVDFLLAGRRGEPDCDRLLTNMARAIQSVCPTCSVKDKRCYGSLEPAQRRLLSAEPLDVPSSRLPDGVITYRSKNTHTALIACRESGRRAAQSANTVVTCFAANTPRPFTVAKSRIDRTAYSAAAMFLLLSALVSCFVCYVLVHFQDYHGHLTHDTIGSGPQKFHAVATPRIGGLALLIALLTTGAGIVPIEQRFSVEEYGYFILAALPAFAAGFAEDLTKKVGVLPRLAFTMLAALMGVMFLAAVLRKLDVPIVDHFLMSTPFAIAFTIFAVGGIANAINIIDGYNGLVGGYAILVLAAIAWVANQVGDMFIFTAALAMVGALIGFFVWNYPGGKIFLGDGGAYFLGFWLGELSVLLVVRHPEVSAWFPLLLLVYPIFETLFSIYRKKILRGHSPGHPDGLHFHMLIYKRLIKPGPGAHTKTEMVRRNSMVSHYVWIFSLLCVVPSIIFWRHTVALVTFSVLFCALYVWLYGNIARLNAPSWLVRRIKTVPSLRT